MKTKSDPRHLNRVKDVKYLFEKVFRNGFQPPKNSQAGRVLEHQKAIDKLIIQNAPAWPISQIAPVDLATLRLAIWELLFNTKKEPHKVVVDEAVEIAKEFGSESSPKFVNGVLGSIISSKLKGQISK
ncbi:transcription antitermination factor NusB [Candidatus Curtissbacteria bacterium RIFCSPHIGHO2_01_FULL_41_13]|uniref:Transcription antitermination factor NusB n=1 Tax=Candidatus Curtissbacteria bacterium RIFCSPHIGHO2_01_FULL_41_13 TaxID=1797745 RepID=A0A1F5FZJ0_9BACT|nr:MAG: transcription antitermination factor NusB [Candidatus Curtissbacteria bacterium RIFCSPHIGHO2_01_FULL_41_13]